MLVNKNQSILKLFSISRFDFIAKDYLSNEIYSEKI